MDPITIGLIVGALAGAGKTALNKDERKKPTSWITNILSGAAMGGMGGAGAGSAGAAALKGAAGGFTGGGSGGLGGMPTGGFDGARTLTAGATVNDGTPGGGNMDWLKFAGDVLKNKTANQQPQQQPGIQNIDYGNLAPLSVGYVSHTPMPQFQVDPLESLMYKRQRGY